MNTKQKLGAKIRFLRKKHKYTQEYVAELIDINPRQVVRIENGESMPTIENLEKIASVFKVDVEELFINSTFDDDEILREKIYKRISALHGQALRALYLMVINL